MVDQQTPSVRSEDELDREDIAPREVRERRENAGDLPVESNRRAQSDAPEQLPPDGNIADIDRDREARASDREALVRADDPRPAEAAGPDRGSDLALFDEASSKDLRNRWLTIQMEFVDSPKDAVQKAEQLVGEVMTQLSDGFARQRRELESGWSGSEDTSTEDLRLAIRRYRSFFNRLLAL
jgi:hypothetical protein